VRTLQPSQPLERPDAGCEREQRRVRVGQPPHAKSRLRELVPQLAFRVPANFAAERRMVPLEHVERCDVDHHRTAWFQHPKHLADRRLLVRRFEAIEHVEGEHHVHRRVCERKVRHAALQQTRQAAGVREFESAPEELETERNAVPSEEREVGARAATCVEQSGHRPPRRGLCDERCDEALEAAKPEVPLFGFESSFEQFLHHAAF
jgi:hypothetical protein